MTSEQKEIIARLQRNGMGYRTIAAKIGLPVNSVKSWCRRHPVEEKSSMSCRQCGTTISQRPGKRARIFCSDRCRYQWWAAHPDSRKNRTEYRHVCLHCGKEFVNNRITAAYCGRHCFAEARRKAAQDG